MPSAQSQQSEWLPRQDFWLRLALILLLSLDPCIQLSNAAEIEDPEEVASQQADSYIERGRRLKYQPQDRAEQLSLFYKGFALMPDSNIQKAYLANEIAALERLSRQTQDSNIALETQKPKFDESISKEMKMRLFAANMMEKEDRNRSSTYWIALADCEASSGNLDAALAHARHGISVCTNPHAIGINKFIASILPSRSQVISGLASKGRPSAAESLLAMAADRAKQVYGDPSWPLESQYAQLCVYLLEQNKPQKAGLVLANILAVDPAKEGFNSDSREDGIKQLLWELMMASTDGNIKSNAFIPALETVLKSQRKCYGADDYRVAETLAAIGDLQLRLERNEAAEKCFRENIAIMSLYGSSGRFEQLQRSGALNSLLEKTGRTKEAEQMLAERKAKTTQTNMSITFRYQDASIEQLEKFYQSSIVITPYSENTLNCAEILLKKYQALGYWQKIPPLVTDVLKIQTRSTPSPRGVHGFTYLISEHRGDMRKLIIEAYVKLDQSALAQFQMQQAIAELPARPSAQDYVYLGEDADLIGDREQSLKYWRLARDHMEGVLDAWPFGPRITSAFDRLGATEDKKKAVDKTALEKSKFGLEQKRKAAKWERIRPSAPAVVNTFPPVEQLKDTYCFNYAALAGDVLSMRDGAKVRRYDGPRSGRAHAFAGCFGHIVTDQKINHASRFSFVYVGEPRSLGPLKELNRSTNITTERLPIGEVVFTAPPAMPMIPFMSAPVSPANAKKLGDVNTELVLEPGDYSASCISTDSIKLPKIGRVRIFITDANPGKGPVFLAKMNARINHSSAHPSGYGEENHNQYRLEIWYNGSRTIKFDEHTDFHGLIYAPHATIKLGPGLVTFMGSAVAKNIYATGPVTFFYEQGLAGWSDSE